jgi:hypothetical protein
MSLNIVLHLTYMICGTEMQDGGGWWQHGIDKRAGVGRVCQGHNISMPS